MVAKQVCRSREALVAIVREEDEQHRNDRARVPSELRSRLATRANVPAEAPEHTAGIVDLSLHLDAEQDSIGGPIREHVDPATGPAVADLDFCPNVESEAFQAAHHVRATAGVDGVALTRVRRKPDPTVVDGQPEPEGCERGRRQLDV
jgi:hypothetical protein